MSRFLRILRSEQEFPHEEELRRDQRKDPSGQSRRPDRRRGVPTGAHPFARRDRPARGRRHDRYVRRDVLVGRLPQLRPRHAADPHGAHRAQRRPRKRRPGGRRHLRGRHRLRSGAPRLRRRPRHRGAGGRPQRHAGSLGQGNRRLSAAPYPLARHARRHQRGDPLQPAQLLPELQRRDQLFGADAPYLYGNAAAQTAQCFVQHRRRAVAPAQRSHVPYDRHGHAHLRPTTCAPPTTRNTA